MARYNRSEKPDPQVQQVLDTFVEYESAHSNALIEARRGRNARIYLRIIDPDFGPSGDDEGMDEVEREDEVWKYLEKLPNKILRQLSLLVLVTPEEAPHYGSSIEFDNPLPPLPIPDFSADGLDQSQNGYAINGMSANGQALLVPLEAQEVDAVKELARSAGLEHEDLVRSWVLEKLELATTAA